MALLIAGGSSNIVLNLNNGLDWQLTGLDEQQRVLLNINVKLQQGMIRGSVNIYLPLISSLNGRFVNFNIDANDYFGQVSFYAMDGNFINGINSIDVLIKSNVVIPVSVGSSDNYILMTLA